MARWADTEDDDWDDTDDGDDPDDDDEPSAPCRHCNREIPEDVARCPYCGQYTSIGDAPPRRWPWWMVVGFLACFYVVYRWMFQLW